MMKRPVKSAKRSSRAPIVLGLAALVVVVVVAGAWWFRSGAPPVSGTPRLAVDRSEIDLGYLRFGTPAYAAFTITNTGDGALTLDPGSVRVVRGC